LLAANFGPWLSGAGWRARFEVIEALARPDGEIVTKDELTDYRGKTR
jgi:hypothetical protein